MDGFVADYISTFTAEVGRQPTYEEYSQIMTGFTPDQVPVLNGLARAFGVFDHWFCEVPSQTFMNRSFWTAATSSGLTVNFPAKKWFTGNDAETLFERLEAHGKTWKIYVSEPMQISFTGIIHHQRLKDRLATHFVPFAQFEADAAKGALPDFSLISPPWPSGTTTTTRQRGERWATGWSSPASTRPHRSWAGRPSWPGSTTPTGVCSPIPGPMSGTPPCSSAGTNQAAPTTTCPLPQYPRPTRPPRPRIRLHVRPLRLPGTSHHRLPRAAEGQVFNQEHRHTSLIATLREQWNLGNPFTARDAAARMFSHAFTLQAPRNPKIWPVPNPTPECQAFSEDNVALGKVVSALGITFLDGLPTARTRKRHQTRRPA